MRIALTLAALSASLLETQGSAGLIRQQGQHLPQPPPPPPPPAIYDPQAGPFIVRLNEKREVGDDQRGVIANAIANWSGPTLQAFVICFRPSSEHIDGIAANKALQTVSRELKKQGAQIVVMPSGGLCAPSSARPNWKGAHVEIMGVVRI